MPKYHEFQFDDEFYNEIENAVADGADSTRKIAEAIGVKYNTFRNWRFRKNSDKNIEIATRIEAAIKKGAKRRRTNIRAAAEDALLKSITGYYIEEEITEIKKDEKTGKQVVQKKKTRKYISPSVTAQIFALCNVAPEQWKSIHKLDVRADDAGSIVKWLSEQAEQGRK